MAKTAFESALEAWQKTRHPRFAAIVEAIAKGEPERELVGASGKKVDSAKWFALAEEGDWRDMPRLVATVASGNSPQALERLNKLAERDDPRLVPGLLAIAEKPPYTAGTSKKFWKALVTALEASRDVRARDGMQSLSTRYKSINDTHMGAWVAGAMAKAAAKIKDPKPLDAKQEAALAKLELEYLGQAGATLPTAKPKPSTSLGEIFATIIDAPDDDDARLVYADLLAEQGQPERAELIVLQIERSAGRATPERADLERTKYTLSPLLQTLGAPVSAAADKVEFDRGFPHQVDLAITGLAHVADAVEWGTVRVLKRCAYAPVNALLKLLDGGKAKNLDTVSALHPRWLDKLKTATFPWRDVTFINEKLRPEHLKRFPKLTSLELTRTGPEAGRFFAAVPDLESARYQDVSALDGADLFADNPRLSRLSLGRSANPDRFAGLAIRELSIVAEAAAADAWLRGAPSIAQLHLSQSAYDPVAMADLFDRHPALQRLEFSFARHLPGPRLERDGGSLTLVLAAGPRWSGYYESVIEAAKPLEGRVKKLLVYPPAPRHRGKPLEDADVEPLRAAWPNLEIRELL